MSACHTWTQFDETAASIAETVKAEQARRYLVSGIDVGRALEALRQDAAILAVAGGLAGEQAAPG